MYPVGIHFLISEGLTGICLLLMMKMGMIGQSEMLRYTIGIGGIANMIILIPGIYFYKKDQKRIRNHWDEKSKIRNREWKDKKLILPELLWLMIMGGGLAFIGNIAITLLNILFLHNTSYSTMMTELTMGKSIWMLIFWIGVIGPITEEVIFRWLVYRRLREYVKVFWAVLLSSMMFGIYHGNLIQFLYATLLGVFFAGLYEKTKNNLCPLMLHIGANITSLLFSMETFDAGRYAYVMEMVMYGMIAMTVLGCFWFFRKEKPQGELR